MHKEMHTSDAGPYGKCIRVSRARTAERRRGTAARSRSRSFQISSTQCCQLRRRPPRTTRNLRANTSFPPERKHRASIPAPQGSGPPARAFDRAPCLLTLMPARARSRRTQHDEPRKSSGTGARGKAGSPRPRCRRRRTACERRSAPRHCGYLSSHGHRRTQVRTQKVSEPVSTHLRSIHRHSRQCLSSRMSSGTRRWGRSSAKSSAQNFPVKWSIVAHIIISISQHSTQCRAIQLQ